MMNIRDETTGFAYSWVFTGAIIGCIITTFANPFTALVCGIIGGGVLSYGLIKYMYR